ncbi:hypothetical protein EC9_53540 [Rosistilla ulvae]|uniref:Uncharacterized protein n=1 Tax=Rosistilla ulvae TaxID=1930277 RepID=A0A517M8D8_9BACT|nr:hypothetical protein EC9_53540 [Rosistilla ulvae]
MGTRLNEIPNAQLLSFNRVGNAPRVQTQDQPKTRGPMGTRLNEIPNAQLLSFNRVGNAPRVQAPDQPKTRGPMGTRLNKILNARRARLTAWATPRASKHQTNPNARPDGHAVKQNRPGFGLSQFATSEHKPLRQS